MRNQLKRTHYLNQLLQTSFLVLFLAKKFLKKENEFAKTKLHNNCNKSSAITIYFFVQFKYSFQNWTINFFLEKSKVKFDFEATLY